MCGGWRLSKPYSSALSPRCSYPCPAPSTQYPASSPQQQRSLHLRAFSGHLETVQLAHMWQALNAKNKLQQWQRTALFAPREGSLNTGSPSPPAGFNFTYPTLYRLTSPLSITFSHPCSCFLGFLSQINCLYPNPSLRAHFWGTQTKAACTLLSKE